MRQKVRLIDKCREYKMASKNLIMFYKKLGINFLPSSKVDNFYFYFYKDVIFDKDKLKIDKYIKVLNFKNIDYYSKNSFIWVDYYIQTFEDYSIDKHDTLYERYIVFKFTKFLALHKIDKTILYNSLNSLGYEIINDDDLMELLKVYDVVYDNIKNKKYKKSFRRPYEVFNGGDNE